jgi:hypothetical protein
MLEKLFSGPYLMFLGVLLWSAVMMRTAAVKSRNSRNRDVAREIETELCTKQRSAKGQFQQLEIRLHDYDCDVAARVQTTMTMLDQLIDEADREILRLETLLEERQADRPALLSGEQRRMVAHLAGAGYTLPEIARLIDRPTQVIAQVLEHDQAPDQEAA